MKKIYILTLSCLIVTSLNVSAQTPRCGSEEYFRKLVAAHPELQHLREEFYKQAEHFRSTDEPGRSVPRIIPVVFHVIHIGGTENISAAQIEDQVRILNLDYRRLNADTTNIPAPFKPLAADCNIEFRLAQKDPNGNCTDGIERIYSTLTNNADEPVKALSNWPRSKYFNIWVVKSIASTPPFITLGYSSPPPPLSTAAEDGVVIRSDYVGSIGTSSAAKAGRVLTHESGHWLGLQHIWGDAICGDDGVNDTPVHEDLNFGCPTFPKINTCAGGDPVNGEMFTNYMDYANGDCQNMFTSGQKTTRMDWVLSNAVSRANIVSAANLTATGTTGTPPVLCAPVAEFFAPINYFCSGSSISFSNSSFNADTMTFNWQFPGGNPSSSTLTNPTVQYANAGTYSVTLTATNSAGSSTKIRSSYIHVSGAASLSVPYANGFESAANFPHYDGYVLNPDSGNMWLRYTGAGSSGTSSIRIVNYSGSNVGEIDEYILPSLNFSNLTQGMMTYMYAYAQRNSTSNDAIKVFVSTNCGQTWVQRLYKAGVNLATAPSTTSPFVPSSSQWVQQSISMASYSGMPNVRIKFQGISGAGNNVFIDAINITGVVGMDEISSASNFSVYPNPSYGNIFISFTSTKETEAEIVFTDAVGRTVLSLGKINYPAGENLIPVENNLTNGIYFVHIKSKGSLLTRPLAIMRD